MDVKRIFEKETEIFWNDIGLVDVKSIFFERETNRSFLGYWTGLRLIWSKGP